LEILKFLNEEGSEVDALVDRALALISALTERRAALISATVTGRIGLHESSN
jgi:hypothetical protein